MLPDSKEYEVVVNDSPTTGELEEIFKLYHEDYDKDSIWDNVGLKMNGRSNETLWLDQYVVKDEINMPKKEANKDVYSARQIMQQIQINRDKYLTSIKEDDAPPSQPPEHEEVAEAEIESLVPAESNG